MTNPNPAGLAVPPDLAVSGDYFDYLRERADTPRPDPEMIDLFRTVGPTIAQED